MTTRVVVVGAGGFGRETLDVIEALRTKRMADLELVGVLDDHPSPLALSRLHARRVAHLGDVASWLAGDDDALFALGVGNPATRALVARLLEEGGRRPVTLVHPSAGVGVGSIVGPGTVVCAGVQVSTNVRLGRHVHLNPNATVGHDAILEDFVSINPAAVISGEVYVSVASLVGAAAVVLQGLTVGAEAVIGAASCVTRDVPASTTVKGIPAR